MRNYDNDFLIGCLSTIMGLAIICGIVAYYNNNEQAINLAKEKTEQVRIEACLTIEDEGVRGLCINYPKKGK